jgi:hypothetical protein
VISASLETPDASVSSGVGGNGAESSLLSIVKGRAWNVASMAETGVDGNSSTAATGSFSSPSTSGVAVPMFLAFFTLEGFSDESARVSSEEAIDIGSRTGCYWLITRISGKNCDIDARKYLFNGGRMKLCITSRTHDIDQRW